MPTAPLAPLSRTLRPPIAILVLMSMLGPLAMNIFLPSMLGIQRHFTTDFATVQLGLSLFLVALAVSQLVLGALSDRFGRRPVLLAGLSLFLLGTLICLLTPSIEMFLAGRVVQGAGGSAGLILARAIVRDLYERDRAASMIGYVTMGMAVAPMIGPAVAGYLDTLYGWQSSFYLLLGFGGLVLAASALTVHETNLNKTTSFSPAALIGQFGQLMRLRPFWLFTGISSFAAGMFFAFLGGAPFVSEIVLKLSPQTYGVYFVLVALGYSIGNFLSGRFAGRLGVFRMILIGNVLAVFGIGLMAGLFALLPPHPMLLFGPMMLLSTANGLVLPSAIAGTVSVRPDLAGSASGLSGSFQMATGAALSYVVGLVLPLPATPNVWPLIIAMALSLSLALVIGLVLQRDARTDAAV